MASEVVTASSTESKVEHADPDRRQISLARYNSKIFRNDTTYWPQFLALHLSSPQVKVLRRVQATVAPVERRT